ncbi:MAG: Clp protease N-terminal domain-containing protein, partial [Chloroflexota bacterium]
MPNKMERFTQRARRVLSLAQEEAERLQHNHIGTEHLLLGLMREDGGVAGRVLRELGLDQRRVEELVERMTRATTRPANAQLDLSPGTKRVLELAVDEARRMGHH